MLERGYLRRGRGLRVVNGYEKEVEALGLLGLYGIHGSQNDPLEGWRMSVTLIGSR